MGFSTEVFDESHHTVGFHQASLQLDSLRHWLRAQRRVSFYALRHMVGGCPPGRIISVQSTAFLLLPPEDLVGSVEEMGVERGIC